MIIFQHADADEIIALLERNAQKFIYPGVNREQQEHVAHHFNWMRAQTGELNITCRIETVPERAETKLVITATFHKPGPTQ